MPFYWLVLGILGVWRVTHLLHAEDGPWNVVARVRLKAGRGFWAGLLDCFHCSSLWVAIPFAYFLGDGIVMSIFLWPAFSAGAILLERVTTRVQPTAVPYWREENANVVLWEEQIGGHRDDRVVS